VGTLNPPTALRWFINHTLTSIEPPESSFTVLCHLLEQLCQDQPTLLSTLTSNTKPSPLTSVLFDEDPINDYSEERMVLELVANSIKSLPLTDEQLIRLSLLLPDEPDPPSETSPWTSASHYKSKSKVKVLKPLIDIVRTHRLSHAVDNITLT